MPEALNQNVGAVRPDTLTRDTFRSAIDGQLILAPLTKGGNLPFRRLCAYFGADVTMSEMAYARQLVKGAKMERARLYRAPSEKCFGVQIACKQIAEGARAAELVSASGAQWIDLNCGCPTIEVSRRGLGAVLLRKPRKLGTLVEGLASASDLPLSVKVRLGVDAQKINVFEVAQTLEAAGAVAVTVHGRTMEQRYRKPADWALIEQVAAAVSIPVVGNGDILTHYEARRRLEQHGCTAVMAGRGALIKPWIFKEFVEGPALSP
ncbi:hypothetical protein CYMTET_48452 [Cymbomonas tetramitiformis]|uniref:tRNA-dihydrouridine(47) synthase [NAD(P)(+)] n=1 Tax=Cymbomonas tetramitiformis TaxID=36881 RepID=A0AAE0BS93_9CHLO|nr:hypothetical protein CYMTET_48452 [Cymbomonas tetramitiformis]